MCVSLAASSHGEASGPLVVPTGLQYVCDVHVLAMTASPLDLGPFVEGMGC